jgi:adenylate cyclase class 2
MLRSKGNALRVREFGGRWFVTFKGEPRYQGPIKVREELESEVEDGEVVRRILGRVGFRPQVSYEKIREAWRLEGVVVTLDHTPIGDFVELEGPSEDLAGVATRLGLDPNTGIRDSYLSLWRTHRERHPELGLPVDMRFDE